MDMADQRTIDRLHRGSLDGGNPDHEATDIIQTPDIIQEVIDRLEMAVKERRNYINDVDKGYILASDGNEKARVLYQSAKFDASEAEGWIEHHKRQQGELQLGHLVLSPPIGRMSSASSRRDWALFALDTSPDKFGPSLPGNQFYIGGFTKDDRNDMYKTGSVASNTATGRSSNSNPRTTHVGCSWPFLAIDQYISVEDLYRLQPRLNKAVRSHGDAESNDDGHDEPGFRVFKYGAATGATAGELHHCYTYQLDASTTTLELCVLPDPKQGQRRKKGNRKFAPFSEKGDSGSAVFTLCKDADGKLTACLVGILWGANQAAVVPVPTYVTPFEHILRDIEEFGYVVLGFRRCPTPSR